MSTSPSGAPRPDPGGTVKNSRQESPVLDLVFVLGVIALFTLVAVVGRGVEKL